MAGGWICESESQLHPLINETRSTLKTHEVDSVSLASSLSTSSLAQIRTILQSPAGLGATDVPSSDASSARIATWAIKSEGVRLRQPRTSIGVVLSPSPHQTLQSLPALSS